MDIIKRQVPDKPLTVTREYPELDGTAERLIRRIESMSLRFAGRLDDRSVSIDLDSVYYIENVERKLFIYTEKDVYRYDGTMADIVAVMDGTELVRISRTCIMNTAHLTQIRQLVNSHLEAVMDNDEKLIVSRKYLKDIKAIFGRGRI